MARNKRAVSTFNLAFIDAMSCGLGAVILLFMIIHHSTQVRAAQKHHGIAENVGALETRVLQKRAAVEQLETALEAGERALRAVQTQAAAMAQQLTQHEAQGAGSDNPRLAQLKTEVRALQAKVDALREADAATVDAMRQYAGSGRRQYLAGLEVKGQHILILVDASASMLDETIVGVIRRRNMDADARRAAAKWRWALDAVDWMTTRVPADAQFQIYTFNTTVASVVSGRTGQWLSAGSSQLDAAIAALRQVVPAGGTSLQRAFAAAAQLSPRPDHIYLLTDGLPTQGSQLRTGTTSPDQRLKLFIEAAGVLPRPLPVHTVLFPMEGDPDAAGAFWQLARSTGGSFLAPSRDWP